MEKQVPFLLIYGISIILIVLIGSIIKRKKPKLFMVYFNIVFASGLLLAMVAALDMVKSIIL